MYLLTFKSFLFFNFRPFAKIFDQENFELKKHKDFNSTKPTNSTFKRTKTRKGAKTLKPF